ncbi:MAG: hypothetical protein EXQ86_08945 [Rhodospirillales bacterium]|nr:hypothetical protein [Rhodospirillales bacterium]
MVSLIAGWLAPFALRIAAALAIAGAVAAVLFGARQAGRAAERVDALRKALEIKNAQLDAANRRPRDRGELARRLRRGEL